MSREHQSRREVLNAIEKLPSMSELLSTHDDNFDYELDLEVIVYGRNYGGKKVGPYVRLLSFDPGEPIVTEGEWGGNTFYAVVDGKVDVLVNTPGGRLKVAELPAGTQFGEMSVLAGVPRNATVTAPPDRPAQVLEVQRPALRLLRKLSPFSDALDKTYRSHGKGALIEDLKAALNLSQELAEELETITQFRVFSKSHVLVRQAAPMDRIYIIKTGWMNRRVEPPGAAGRMIEDFLGEGHCLGLEAAVGDAMWQYTATLMGRTEVLEISASKLRRSTVLRDALVAGLARMKPPAVASNLPPEPEVREPTLEAQRELINTGLVDASNLLIMDMDLCVRCGNCSLACHKVHGQSRLLRRGISVTRLKAPKPKAIQNVLSPAVCMHCKDPECLTGCPTGAIGRYGAGEIDIDAHTCIGCGDCASQCPYNAISLIPRRKEAAAANGFASKLRDLFRVRLDPLPNPVEQTDDLLAVKCNLCRGTSLNPEGSTTPAYGCEESCPTGALARINPRTYFTEIGQIEGLSLADSTHAFGRNIHRVDPPRRLIHAVGILATLLLTAATIYGISVYGLGARLVGFLNMRWITGLVGLVAIAGVMTYPVRRQYYTRRAGALRYWMLGHAYLGVIAGIMLLLHGGAKSGGILTTLLMVSFDLVILTGLYGIVCYIVAPRILTKIEGTPLLLDDLLARRKELREEMAAFAAAGPENVARIVRGRVIPRLVSFGFLLRQFLRREDLEAVQWWAREGFKSELATVSDAGERARLEQAIDAAVTLRRVDALILLHRILKSWLPPHVVFTSLMLALMVVHIIQVVYFAA